MAGKRARWWPVGLILLALAACVRDEGKVQFTPVLGAESLDSAGTFEVDATCGVNQTLVGGGFEILEPPVSTGNPLIVEGSFPVNDRVWRTVVTRPESFAEDRDGSPVAVSTAYCISLDSGLPDMTVVQSDPVGATASGSFESANAQAACPEDTVRTAGGFRVFPDFGDSWDVAGLYSAWVWGSFPTPGGWEVQIHRILGQQGPTPPQVRAYALCAGAAIDSVRDVSVEATKRDPSINYGYWDSAAACNESEIASGGGYMFHGDPLVPHVLMKSHSQLSQGLWAVSAIHGHQTGATGGYVASAVCLEIPQIIDVSIVTPMGEVCTDCVVLVEYPVEVGADPDNPSQSELIAFEGLATDGQGDPITGSALEWTAFGGGSGAGIALGTGDSLSARLPVPVPGESVGYIVELVASDADGNQGVDSVAIIVVGSP